ncbi:hypothetical protein ACCT04_36755, partial [Rhizobium ruizarguesonis]
MQAATLPLLDDVLRVLGWHEVFMPRAICRSICDDLNVATCLDLSSSERRFRLEHAPFSSADFSARSPPGKYGRR